MKRPSFPQYHTWSFTVAARKEHPLPWRFLPSGYYGSNKHIPEQFCLPLSMLQLYSGKLIKAKLKFY